MLDGAVLVISAVEGVQAQTRVLMRALQRLALPTLMFVNKIDRGGARVEHILAEIREKLSPGAVPMGSVQGQGTRHAVFTPYGAGDAAFTSRLADVVADHDDEFLAAYLDDDTAISHGRARAGLAALTRAGLVHPVFSGSALTGAGVDALACRPAGTAACREGTGGRPRLGHRVQGRPRAGRGEDRLRPDVLRHGPGPRPPAVRP